MGRVYISCEGSKDQGFPKVLRSSVPSPNLSIAQKLMVNIYYTVVFNENSLVELTGVERRR